MIHAVRPIRQWHGYDCGAAVLRMGVLYLTGRRLTRRRAILETGCNPDGVSFTRLKRVFRDFGVSVGRLAVSTSIIRKALDKGRLVVIDDNNTYAESHVILIVGYTRKHFWVIDPIIALPTRRSHRRVTQSADACFSVYAKAGRRKGQ
jgi:ABC-type bacteriocin/lantibiotic exporter with double-glycine peptidase domain